MAAQAVKAPKTDSTTDTGQSTLNPGQLQNSMDLLSIAIGQTSRDPTILANVLQNIERRHAELMAGQAAEAERQAGLERISAQGTEERKTQAEAFQQRGVLQAQEQQATTERTLLEQRGATARNVYSEQKAGERQATMLSAEQKAKQEQNLQDMISDMGTQLAQLLPESTRVGGGGGMQALIANALSNVKAAGPMDAATSANVTSAFQQVAQQVPTFNVNQALNIVKGIAMARAAALPTEELAQRATDAIQLFSDQMSGIGDKLAKGEKLSEPELQFTSEATANQLVGAIRDGSAPDKDVHQLMAHFFKVYKDQPEVLENTLEQALVQAGDMMTNDPVQLIQFIDTMHSIIADGLLEPELPELEHMLLGLHNRPKSQDIKENALMFQDFILNKVSPLSPELMTPLVPPR